MEKSIRAQRKDEHIKYFMENDFLKNNGFEDIQLQNNSLPEIDYDEINTRCKFLDKEISFPLIVNAMTGGTDYGMKINRMLAVISRNFNIPIAVGSQTLAICEKNRVESFKIIRDINHNGIVLANLSARMEYDYVLNAIEMINADAIQLHLNVPQEICMLEGDREFKGILKNIEKVAQKIDIPVIVKEVGFGMSYDTAKRLSSIGIRYIDVGGYGGTNFIKIENYRRKDKKFSFLETWGIKTALSILECRKASNKLFIIGSGGITTAEEIIKAIRIGANIVGISGFILNEILSNGLEDAEKKLNTIVEQTKIIMLLLGAKTIDQLRNIPIFIKGELNDICCNKFNDQFR